MAIQLESDGGGDEMISAINVTPLVDIMLVLLVVFMVTARLISQSSVPMDLPKAASGNVEQTIWSITVSADGAIRVNDEPVQDKTALAPSARAALAKTPELRAVISASRHTEHGVVVSVLDELRKAGLVKVAFGVSPEDAT
jgi:biopolymer transport protein ExbD